MTKQNPKNPKDDFDPSNTLKDLHDTLTQPNKFAKIFCEAAQSQISVREEVEALIRKLISTDQKTRDGIKGLLKEYEKEEVWILLKRGGNLLWSFVLLIMGASIDHFIFK